MTTDPQDIQNLFHIIVALPLEERATALDLECGDQPEVRQRVEELLEAHEEQDSFLDESAPPFQVTNISDPAVTVGYHRGLEPGVVVSDRYTLREKIGEGGMGEVWVAKQTEPVQRKVALKLIKTGMDSKAMLARFDQERQALAMMDHPNIAKVLDAGVTAGGQPFFVMELVNGLPLGKFCDEAKLSLQMRLELFVPICQAVQHAHQKGIVHRDLKPANVLVTMIDCKPVPKVIDFGVAKAVGGKLTDETMTEFGAVVGTLEYMSPEQAGFSGEDVDTRADIYSLGVLLYELLTGLRPIDKARLKQAALTEMIRIIREEEPSKPSTRLSTDEALPSLAAVRQCDPKKLTAMLRGDLDWVVMKCLEKNRDRRYETANGLVRDIQRYLIDEPVEARPPSARYRLRKFLKRNKRPAIAASMVLLTLVVGIAGTSYGLIEAKRQERLAVQEAMEKEVARKAESERAEGEKQAKLQAKKRLKQIEKANAILGSIFDRLNPEKVVSKEIRLTAILAQNLEKAAAQLEGDAIGDPLVVATTQNRLATALMGLGKSKKAIVLLEKALTTQQAKLGPRHRKTLISMSNLASAYHDVGDWKQSLRLNKKSFELATTHLGPEDFLTISCMNDLAMIYQDMGDPKRAIPLLESAVKLSTKLLGPEDQQTLVAMNSLARAYQLAGDWGRALPLIKTTLDLMTAKLGPTHPNTLTSMNNLAIIYRETGELERAVSLHEKSLELATANFVPGHPLTLTCMNNLAKAHQQSGDLKRAIPLYETAFKLMTANFGRKHPHTLTITRNLAEAYHKSRDPIRAIPLYEKSLKLQIERYGPEHLESLVTMNHLSQAYKATGNLKRAVIMAEKMLKSMTAAFGPKHPNTLTGMNNLGTIYLANGDLPRAIALFKKTLKLRTDLFGTEDPHLLIPMKNLTRAYLAAGRSEQALEQLAKVAAADPKKSIIKLAALQIWFGRKREFAATAERALRFATGTEGPAIAARMAKVCCLQPGDDKARFIAALKLARNAVELGKTSRYLPHYRLAMGMAEYRNGNFATADRILMAVVTNGKTTNRRVIDISAFYRAMSLFRQGKPAEARQLAIATAATMKPLPRDEKIPLADKANAYDVIVWLAYKEAQSLIKFPPRKQPKQPAVARKPINSR